MPRIALYQPDIAQNLGTIFRMAACLDMPVEIIEPCGFPFDDRKFRRSGMDYIDHVDYRKHASWEQFKTWQEAQQSRLILLTTKTHKSYTDFTFHPNDILLFGRESAGVPDNVHQECEEKLTIPMKNNMRSLNIAISAAMICGEALRQVQI